MDTFSCGTCHTSFNALEAFLLHKQSGCNTSNDIPVSLGTTPATDTAAISIDSSTTAVDNGSKIDGIQIFESIKEQLSLRTFSGEITDVQEVHNVLQVQGDNVVQAPGANVLQVQGDDVVQAPGAKEQVQSITDSVQVRIPTESVQSVQEQNSNNGQVAVVPVHLSVADEAHAPEIQVDALGSDVQDTAVVSILQVQAMGANLQVLSERTQVQRPAEDVNFSKTIPSGSGVMSVEQVDEVGSEYQMIHTCQHCDVYTSTIEEIRAHCTKHHNLMPNESITKHIKSFRPLSKKLPGVPQGSNLGPCKTTYNPLIASGAQPEKRKRGRPRKYPQGKLVQTASVVGIGNENIPVMALAPSTDSNQDAKPKRKPGRPRKSEQAPQVSAKDQKKKETAQIQSFWDEENLKCRNCIMKFSRLRQLHSHRCLVDVLDKVLSTPDEDDETSNDEMKMVDSSLGAPEKKPVLKIDVSEEEKVNIEKTIFEHEIPQSVNDSVPVYTRNPNNNALKVYTCPYCEKFFKFKQGMIHHIRMHTKYKPFKCKVCDYASSSKGNLIVHERKHSGERFKCSWCTYTCISKGHLNVHIKRRHKNMKMRTVCDLCHKNVYSLSNLLRHLETSHQIKQPGKAQLYYEKKRMESREGQRSLLYQCNVCDRKFKAKRAHDSHMRLHLDEKPFSCSLCDYKSVQQEYLEQHARKHRQVYICSVCKDIHLSTSLLKEHIATHATEQNDDDQNEQDNIFWESLNCSMYLAEIIDPELESAALGRETTGEFEAATVDYLQEVGVPQGSNLGPSQSNVKYGGDDVTEEELKQILKIDHCALKYRKLNRLTYEAILKLYGQMECKLCGKSYMYKTHLENHVKIHLKEKEFKCDHENCRYSTHSALNLTNHKESKHGAVQYKCAECGFQTSSNMYLQTHMRRHAVQDAFKCTRCDAKFSLEKDVKDHIVDNHPSMFQEEIEGIIGRRTHLYRKSKREWFQCKNCPQKFRTLSEMRQHLWMHQGLTPYKCEICGHGTRSMSNLKTHMLRHSDAKTHLCDECGKSFKTKNSLKVHALSQHSQVGQNNEVYKISYQCKYCDFTCMQRSQLKKHLDTHSGSRPYRCGICVQHFSNSKCGLRSHYSKQHPDVEFNESLLEEGAEDGPRLEPWGTPATMELQQQPVMQYKCAQCQALCTSYTLLEEHLRNEHNLEIATSGEENAAAALIQAAQMVESSMEESAIVVQDVSDGSLGMKSAAELLQQIISMQGLGGLPSGGNQVQIQLPGSLVSEGSVDTVQAYNITDQATTSNSPDAIQTYEVTQAAQQILEGQAQGEDGSSIMQVQFRVEGGEDGQQIIFMPQAGVNEEQQVVVVNSGELGQVYEEGTQDTEQAEVVQISIATEEDDSTNQEQSQIAQIQENAITNVMVTQEENMDMN